MAKKICFSDYLDAMEFRRDFPITCWLLEHLPRFVEEFKKLEYEFVQNAIMENLIPKRIPGGEA